MPGIEWKRVQIFQAKRDSAYGQAFKGFLEGARAGASIGTSKDEFGDVFKNILI